MFWTKNKVSTRKVILSMAVLCLAAAGLIVGAQFNSTDASTALSATNSSAASPAATFPGTGTGAIPDGLSGTPPQYGPPLVVSFAVSGVAGAISNIDVSMTLTHTWVGDVEMILAAPGGSPSMHLASRIGVTAAGSFGDSSEFGGTYTFDDSAAGSNIWTVATVGTCGDTCVVTVGSYRTVAPGQTGQTNPPAVTSLQTTFGSLTPAQANGTWTLTYRDAGSDDIGTVTAANLTIDAGVVAPDDAPVDMNGDGKTDYVIVRNTGGGPSGQMTWRILENGSGATSGALWGIQGDEFVPADYDGDDKDDIAVWRPLPGTDSTWYVLNSQTSTVRQEFYGLNGDDPSVVGDYNGDGRADLAIYRAGAASGDPSFWIYRTTVGGPLTYIHWGQNGDFPTPGDYDGDGSADFGVQRNGGGGQARFFFRYATGTIPPSLVFGTPTDVIVPGDYDGDDKDDVAVVRGSGGNIHWYYRRSIDGAIVGPIPFGNSATDFPAQGDYDGDGTTDVAIWRPNADPTMCFFWSRSSSTGAAVPVEWGQNGDYPVANYNTH